MWLARVFNIGALMADQVAPTTAFPRFCRPFKPYGPVQARFNGSTDPFFSCVERSNPLRMSKVGHKDRTP
jgi:hypothetical protein